MSEVVVKIQLPSGIDTTKSEIRVVVNRGMRILGEMARDYWHSLVNAELNTSYQAYRNSMELDYEPGPAGVDRAVISISGFLPVAVELGLDKFDMKNRFPTKKGKNWQIIPMHHGSTRGSAGDRRMHVPPADIRALMKDKPPRTVLTNTPARYHLANQITGVRWHSPRYERMTKYGPGGKYAPGWYTFRTMSSKARGLWEHPGFKAKMFHLRVIDHVQNTLVAQVFDPLVKVLQD